MKTQDIKFGKKYMLSLGRRGYAAVTVISYNPIRKEWVCARDGSVLHASSRRLSPCPITDSNGKLLGYAHEEFFTTKGIAW